MRYGCCNSQVFSFQLHVVQLLAQRVALQRHLLLWHGEFEACLLYNGQLFDQVVVIHLLQCCFGLSIFHEIPYYSVLQIKQCLADESQLSWIEQALYQ